MTMMMMMMTMVISMGMMDSDRGPKINLSAFGTADKGARRVIHGHRDRNCKVGRNQL